MRPIDADSLQRRICGAKCGCEYEDCGNEGDCGYDHFISNAPIIDAVPVVRCRDCKYHYWEQEPCHGKSVHYCKLPHMRGVEVFKEFFCYYGERKEGAE